MKHISVVYFLALGLLYEELATVIRIVIVHAFSMYDLSISGGNWKYII